MGKNVKAKSNGCATHEESCGAHTVLSAEAIFEASALSVLSL